MSISIPIPTEIELKQAFQVIKGEQIPSIPDILIKLYDEFEKEEPDTVLITDLVSKDQAITGQVIKTVNSPQFGLGQSVELIQQAVVMLGLEQIRNLVTAAIFKNTLHVKSHAAMRIWHDSLLEARVAMNVAYEIQDIPQDEIYLAALLHNCGALLLAEKFTAYEQLLGLDNNYPVSMIGKENQLFGTNHQVIGYLFAKHWKLPDRICQAIYLHHALRCDEVGDPDFRALLATIKVAHLLVREKELPEDAFLPERIQYFAYAQKELMLNDDYFDELRKELIPELRDELISELEVH